MSPGNVTVTVPMDEYVAYQNQTPRWKTKTVAIVAAASFGAGAIVGIACFGDDAPTVKPADNTTRYSTTGDKNLE